MLKRLELPATISDRIRYQLIHRTASTLITAVNVRFDVCGHVRAGQTRMARAIFPRHIQRPSGAGERLQSMSENHPSEPEKRPNFVLERVEQDVAAGKNGGRVMPRFPPQANEDLHVGHAKSICLNFGLSSATAQGVCNLRFDDTNPSTEEDEFVPAIQHDVRWLGFDWGDRLYFASDYFEQAARDRLGGPIEAGKAYVDISAAKTVWIV